MTAYLIFFIVLCCCSALMSGSETALFGLSEQQLQHFRRSSHPLQRLAGELMRDGRKVLLTILIANTTINVLIYVTSYLLTDRLTEASPLLASLLGVVTVVLVIVVCEILPKTLAISIAGTLAPLAAPVIRVLEIAFTPLRVILEFLLVTPLSRLLIGGPDRKPKQLTAEELMAVVERSEYHDIIAAHENDMLQEVLALSSIRVRSIMVPRVDMAAFDLRGSRDDLLKLIRERKRTRIPVYQRDVDRMLGVIHARDVYVNPEAKLPSLIRPAKFVPEQMTADRLLVHFRTSKTQFAIVVDEYGGVSGLITLKDLVQQVVGEIPEPGEIDRLVEEIGPGAFRMSGDLNVQPWYAAFGVANPDLRINTLGGLVTALCGRLPRVGDEVHAGRARFTVEHMDGRRVHRVRVHLKQGEGA